MRERSYGAMTLRRDAGRTADAAMSGGEPVVAGAVGSATLASHFGASLEDHGPNVVL